jgi:transposase
MASQGLEYQIMEAGMEAYSMDLRQRVWDAVVRRRETGDTMEDIAKRFEVSEPWIYKLQRRFADDKTLEPKPHGGGQPAKVTEELEQPLCDKLLEQPDASLAELRDHLGISGSIMAVFRALKRLGITRKKKRCMPKNEKIPKFRQNVRNG